MSDPLFDSQKFLHSLANDTELAHELLTAFMEDSPVRTDSLSQALDTNDLDQASKLAHSLKGMCGVVRSNALVNLALNMESSAKNKDMTTTKKDYTLFKNLLESAHAEMREFMESS